MKIEYLEQFINLAECLNYQNAANRSYVSQSTLSKHIFKLESELNCKLIDRNNRKFIQLTNNGETLYKYSKGILNNYYSMLQELQGNKEHHVLNIAFSRVMYEYGVLDLIRKIMKKDDRIRFNISEIEGDNNLFSLFSNNQIDVAFIQEKKMINSQLIKNIYSDNLVAIVPSKSKLNNLDLFKNPALKLIVPIQISPLIGKFEKQVVNHGNQPVKGIPFEANIIQNIMELTSNNIGVAILPKKQASFYLKSNQKIITLTPNVKVFINAYINPKYRNTESYEKNIINNLLGELSE